MKFSISKKIILVAVIGVIISSVIVLCISTILMGNLLTRTIQEDMLAIQSIVARMQNQEKEQLKHNVAIIAEMPDFIEAVYEGDVHRTKEIAQFLKQQLNLDSVAVTDVNGIVIARGHSDRTGDDFNHRSTTKAALRGEIAAGVLYDDDAILPFTVRCDAPIYKNGAIIGTISIANDIGSQEYVNNLRLISGLDFTLYKNNTVFISSIKDTGGSQADIEIKDNQIVVIRDVILNEPVMSAYWEIRGIEGEAIGMWSLTKPLKNHNSETNRVLLLVVACSLGIILLLALIAGMLGRKITKRVVGAEEANRAKSVFLSTMSHEIRSPMNAILGVTEIQLLNEELDSEISEAFEKIYASGDLLLGIINDILDLSKIEAGKFELLQCQYDLASLINDTAQLNMMRVKSKPIGFELYINENIPAHLSGDELRVKQILNNLLSNAFKYTAAGKVKMTVAAENVSEDEVILVVGISDTGQGMTKEQVAALFDEYSRFNAEKNRSTEGTGLGMNITQNLINMMNGEITVESEPGVGSTFTVRLPQKKTDSDILGKEVAENLCGFRINSRSQMKRTQITREPMPYGNVLIVDDVETNIYVARGLLAPYGINADFAESGFAAIEKIKHNKVYDIIFMDHMMPEMDGIETTKKLREMGYDEPIVALTANAVAGQAEIFLNNGFNDFLSKPIDIRQMNNTLNKLIRDKQPPEVIEAARNEFNTRHNTKPKSKSVNDPAMIEAFVRDAQKALKTLEEIMHRNDYNDENNLRTYVINVHGIKNPLINMGRAELSASAMKLESAGRDKNFDVIITETPAFITSLKALVTELTPEEAQPEEEIKDDVMLLREKLAAIKNACGEYDRKTANDSIDELKNTKWSKSVKDLLYEISECLLHSDFEEAESKIDSYKTESGLDL